MPTKASEREKKRRHNDPVYRAHYNEIRARWKRNRCRMDPAYRRLINLRQKLYRSQQRAKLRAAKVSPGRQKVPAGI